MLFSFFAENQLGANSELYIIAYGIGYIFWLWMIIDCVTKESDKDNNKIIWLMVILVAHIPGSMIYFSIRKLNRIEHVLPIQTFTKENQETQESE